MIYIIALLLLILVLANDAAAHILFQLIGLSVKLAVAGFFLAVFGFGVLVVMA